MAFEVTEVKINMYNSSSSKIKAFAKITIDGCFCVDGLKILEGTKGIFVGMPSTKNNKTGEFRDVAFPVNSETRAIITDAVLEAYNSENDNLFDE